MTQTRSLGAAPWLLRTLYVVLILAAISLVVLFLQDVVAALEGADGELHHLFVFDLAWFVSLAAGLATFVAGLAALAVGRRRADARLTRFGLWAVGFVVLAAAAVVIAQSFESPPSDHT
jgi:hypothetical protein